MRRVRNSGHLCPLITRLPKTGVRKTGQKPPFPDSNGRYFGKKKTLNSAFFILLPYHV